ncbi:CAF17-like 4Fe-4S cluster assembly/insertion protein YgfZ [Lysobacter humi (ex Lee et al. 2017)]
MSDNLQSGTASPFALPHIRVIALTGRDAAAFAQAQFMNDVLALPPGRWQWNGWLTPKGRVIALFALLRVEDEVLWLVLPDADPEALTTALRRFVFRSKVAIALAGDVVATGVFAAPALANGPELGRLQDGWELDMGTGAAPRGLRLARSGPGALNAGSDAWALADLESGLPRLGPEQAERWTPQQLSLERLRAFSVKKGCYPGQEIVARTHFLGQAKRALALFEADAPPLASDIEGTAGVWGAVVSTASHGGRHLVLGVGSPERLPPEAHCGGVGLRASRLQEGLAR